MAFFGLISSGVKQHGKRLIHLYSRPAKSHGISVSLQKWSIQSFQVGGPQHREISLFLRNKIGRFLTGTCLFKALPKTIGLRNDFRTVIPSLRRCLGPTFYFGIASQSDVVKPGDDNDNHINPNHFMPHDVRSC